MLPRFQHAHPARRLFTAALASTLLLAATACGGGDEGSAESSSAESSSAESSSAESSSAESSSAESSSAESSSAEPVPVPGDWLGVDAGPADIDAVLTEVGTLEPDLIETDGCVGMPYVADEVVVYFAPGLRSGDDRPQVEETATAVIIDALAAVGLTLQSGSVTNLFESDDSQVTGLAGPIFVLRTNETVSIATVSAAAATIQNGSEFPEGLVLDVNHIGPFLPIGTFHPGSDPVDTDEPVEASDNAPLQHTVLVVDSPDETTSADGSSYDQWGELWSDPNASAPVAGSTGDDGKLDFVAAHGPFVADMIQRAAPQAVRLEGIGVRQGVPSFLFTEDQLIAALMAGLGDDGTVPRKFTEHYDLINFSLGVFGCPFDRHPVLHGALSDVLDPANYSGGLDEGDTTYFIAAAGNDGSDTEHFPAAFADDGDVVGDHTIAVGALADPSDGADPIGACYSNRGWVSTWAPGTAKAAFPRAWDDASGYAEWAGTSFATAFVTRELALSSDQVAATLQDLVATTTLGDIRYESAMTMSPPCPS